MNLIEREKRRRELRAIFKEVEKRFGVCDLCHRSVHVGFLHEASVTARGEVLNVCDFCKGSDEWRAI